MKVNLIGANLFQMTSHIINKPKEVLDNPNQNYTISSNENNKMNIDKNIIASNPEENPLKKSGVHIQGQMPSSVPLNYIPYIPINEKIMKAIPTKIQPQFKKIVQIQEDFCRILTVNSFALDSVLAPSFVRLSVLPSR